jgi:EmrB/QacA subfamily drug resistance transporter
VARSTRFTLIATILGSSIAFIDMTVVNVALPAIQRDLGGGLAAQQWIVDAYLLTLGSLILVGGSLGDIFGEVRVFKFGVAAFGIASALCAFAPDANTLIVFRGLQGIAGALLTPASLAVITSTFSGAERGAAIGTWTAWSAVSTVIGPLLGGWLIDVTSWRVIFLLNVPIAIITVAIAITLMAPLESENERVPVDFLGAALCVAGLGSFVFGFIEQPRRGWADPLVPATIAAGVACLIAFVLWEKRHPNPMLPLGLFKKRNFSVTNIETFSVYGGLSALGFFLALFLQQFCGYSPLQAGLATLPMTIVLFAFSRYAGRGSAKFGPRVFMAAGPLIAGLSTIPLARLPTHFNYWTDLFPSILGFSIGLALTVAPLTTTVLSDAGPSDAGIASGVNNAVARIAGLIAIAVIGLAASNGGKLTEHGFHVATAITAVLICTGGIIGAVGLRNPRSA